MTEWEQQHEPIKFPLHGRRRIVTPFSRITRANLLEALGAAMTDFLRNKSEIGYLIRYDRGIQPVVDRDKEIRPDIIHNTVVNHASEIHAFKVSYLLSDPVIYVSRKKSGDEPRSLSDRVNTLNSYMLIAGKNAGDKELADDFTVTGLSYRRVLANPDFKSEEDCPFIVDTLNPMRTAVVYLDSAQKHSRRVFAFTVLKTDEGQRIKVYTPERVFDLLNNEIVREAENPLGMIPIVEYVNNEARMGAFEPVIDLLNDINVLESNRIEATEQNVQSLMWFNDVELDADQVERLRSKPDAFIFTRTTKDSVTPNIKNVVVDLQQADQQVLANDMYKKILTIVGMPSTGDGNTSDSSNNGSTIVRNGWSQAEARAKDTATLWHRSDRDFLEAVLTICDAQLESIGAEPLGLRADDVIGKFTRRNYEDIMTKATVLTTLLGSQKVHPKIAYQVSNIVPDPEEAYIEGMDWYDRLKEEGLLNMRNDAPQVRVNTGAGYENRNQGSSGTAGNPVQ